ncbi:MAG TPA: hypothetical protein VLH19_02925 [Patescibacteria group bacterium]|nr:hypothetical protein [Patescibacteria group bacterium]
MALAPEDERRAILVRKLVVVGCLGPKDVGSFDPMADLENAGMSAVSRAKEHRIDRQDVRELRAAIQILLDFGEAVPAVAVPLMEQLKPYSNG